MTLPRSRMALLARLAVLLLASGLAAAQAAPPTLTLPEAVALALQNNARMKAARAADAANRTQVQAAKSGYFPQVKAAEEFTAGDDPVFAFGTRLRQGRFAAADFGLTRLNHPDALGDFTTRVGADWTLFDSGQTRQQVKAAQAEVRASGLRTESSEQQTIWTAAQAFYDVLFAQERLRITGSSVQTAEALAFQARARVESGMAVESDRLSAEVHLARRKQDQVEAENDLAMANSELGVVLGTPDARYGLQDTGLNDTPLPDLGRLQVQTLQFRPDLKAAHELMSAQKARIAAARAAYGPRIQSFANWQADNPRFTGGGSNFWTAGFSLQFSIFDGGARQSRLDFERQQSERLRHQLTASESQANLEVQRAYLAYDSAKRRLEIAAASVQQAEESLRIVRNRYEEGLTLVTELLSTEESVRQVQVDLAQAQYRLKLSALQLKYATGELTPAAIGSHP